MKKILFVINTLGQAGAENAMLALISLLADEKDLEGAFLYDISLYVLMGQGELIDRLPARVKLINKSYSKSPILSSKGKRDMYKNILKAMFKRGVVFKLLPYIISNFFTMLKKGHIWFDKLLWRVLSDGGCIINDEYDMAVAYIEGGSAYYVADHVKAAKKACFIHIDYTLAGYTKKLDRNCYNIYDAVFAVSDEVRDKFLTVYPEHKEKVFVFHNIINQKEIIRKSKMGEGFSDNFKGTRLLTVGRLTYQKAYEIAIDAMKLIKEEGYNVRWYVLGDGPERAKLASKIKELGLESDFILLGASDNPYPYYRQTDIYVHATRFEGKSIAIQEAQTLGCAIIASDVSGNREQIENGTDGILCRLDKEGIKEAVILLAGDKDKRMKFGQRAAQKELSCDKEISSTKENGFHKFMELLKGDTYGGKKA